MRVPTIFSSAVLIIGCEGFATLFSATGPSIAGVLFSSAPRCEDRTQWYTCCSTREMLKAVDIFVRETDVVAELGSQLRDVSMAISSKCHSAVLVDVERKFPSDSKDRTRAMRRDGDETTLREDIVFRQIPLLIDWRKALFFDKNPIVGPFDVLVLDVSSIVGNDLEWTTFTMIQEFLALNEAFGGSCRTVLVKSTGLNRIASSLVHGQVWIDRGCYVSKPSYSGDSGSARISTHNGAGGSVWRCCT